MSDKDTSEEFYEDDDTYRSGAVREDHSKETFV